MPFHFVYLTGSVRYTKTSSRGASIRRSISTTRPLSTATFDDVLQSVEVLLPHVTQHHLERAERLAVGAVEPPRALAPLGKQAGPAKHVQVLRYGRPAHVEPGSDLPGGELSIPHQAQDLPPPRIRDGLQVGLHAGYLSTSFDLTSNLRQHLNTSLGLSEPAKKEAAMPREI